MPTRKTRLKPCPFCGAKLKLVEDFYFGEYWEFRHSLGCFFTTQGGQETPGSTEEVRAWNRRAKEKNDAK